MTRALGVDRALVNGEIITGDVQISDGRVAQVGVGSGAGTGRVAVPGFFDVQVNGFGGVDFAAADHEGVNQARVALASTGVTSFLPTLITNPIDAMMAQAEVVVTAPDTPGAAQIAGLHFEGPAISPQRVGAHPAQHVQAPNAELARTLTSIPHLRLVTLAPERDGSLSLIETLTEAGVVVSFGHTEATEHEAQAGFAAGGTAVTHIFNAMRPIAHREPGIAAHALTSPDVFVGLIADGLHVAPTMMDLVARAAGRRLVLVTDACAGALCPDGDYLLGAETISVINGEARRPDGVLAGSTLTMPQAIRNMMDVGVSFSDAVHAATLAPQAMLRGDTPIDLTPGSVADIVITDDDLQIHETLIAGKVVFQP